MLETLKEAIVRIGGKKCEFGFLSDFGSTNDDSFLLEPVGRSSRTVGVSGKKEYTTLASLYYFYFNSLSTNSIEVIKFIDSFLEKIMADEEVKKKIISINYGYTLQNTKESANDITGTIIFQINLEIRER